MDIEVCGERSPYKIYFGMKNLENNLVHDNNYSLDEDYTVFILHDSCKINSKRVRYLTYTGLIKDVENEQPYMIITIHWMKTIRNLS